MIPSILKYAAIEFPDPKFSRSDGLLAIGGSFSPEMLVSAYSQGIFPWSFDPITWWSPDPRAIFSIEGLYISRRMNRIIKSGFFTISFDKAFTDVMKGCASPAKGRGSTWISPEFIPAYARLHELGFAHSVEAWHEGILVGGAYGVAMGGLFAGESMFHTLSNASTVSLYHLFERLKKSGFVLFDSQVITPHTKRLGACEIPRNHYLKLLKSALSFECKF